MEQIYPDISVLMTAYNIGNFIKQAINSVLDQKIEYTYELIIADDCSSDNTKNIVKEFIQNHPKGNLIRYYRNEKNLGLIQNSKYIFSLARGRYIAMIDGDDYWIDNEKLQKQIFFLEKNMDFNSSTGIVLMKNEETNKTKILRDGWNTSKKEEYELSNYLKGPFSQTSSYFFRNNLQFPDWFDDLQSNDAAIFCLATKNGKIKYFKEVFSVYRMHPVNYSSKKTPKQSRKKTKFFLDKINEYFDYKYNSIIKIRLLINEVYYYKDKYKNNAFIAFFINGIILVLFLFNKFFNSNK